MNMCEIRSTALASYHILLHEKIEEIALFARRIGGDSSVINLTMNGESLKAPVNAIITPGNNYKINLFTEQIEKNLQRDDQLLSDDAVEIEVDVPINRQGGGHLRKLTDLPLQQVIKRKKMNLFVHMNSTINNVCFSICLARFLEPQLPESELESRATVIHNDAGFLIQDKIGLHDIARSENQLDIKIVVFTGRAQAR